MNRILTWVALALTLGTACGGGGGGLTIPPGQSLIFVTVTFDPIDVVQFKVKLHPSCVNGDSILYFPKDMPAMSSLQSGDSFGIFLPDSITCMIDFNVDGIGPNAISTTPPVLVGGTQLTPIPGGRLDLPIFLAPP
jgi:hypothetical protein